MNCLNCGAATTNGLALCELCQRWVTTALDLFPVYFRNLARWKPGRAGSRPVPGSRVLWDGTERTGDRVTAAMDEASNAVSTWARMLVADRPFLAEILPVEPIAADLSNLDERDQFPLLCVGLGRHLTSIATTEWAGEFVRELGLHETALRTLTESVAPGWYAGACRRCTVPTHVIPGLTWVTCDGCGATTYARDHLNTVLDEARGWVAQPKSLAAAIVALVDTEASVFRLRKRIAKWGDRDQIAAHRKHDADGDEVGPKRYRLGDVLDMLGREGETTNDESERMSA
jgi:hypothetical protein